MRNTWFHLRVLWSRRAWSSKLSSALMLGLIGLTLTACATALNAGNSSGFKGADGELVNEFPAFNLDEIAQGSLKDVFRIGDKAEITVYNIERLTGEYVVDRAGNISFPLIGNVKVVGLSTVELQEILTQKYGADYLQNPSIDVKIESKEFGRVVVDGAVNEPGVFEVDDIISVSEAIALASGLDEFSNGSEVYIIRSVNGERKVKVIDLRASRAELSAESSIIPNDIVYVEDNAGRVMFREFLRTLPLINTAIIYSGR